MPGTAALKVTTRRGGGGRRRDGLRRGRGGSEKSCGCRPEAPPSRVPRALGGDSRPDPAQRRMPRNPLTFTISRGGRGRRQPARGPRTPPLTSPESAAVAGAPSCQDPRAAPRPPRSARPPPQVTCPAAAGRRLPLTSPGSRNHFPRGERKGSCRRVGAAGR